MALHFPQKPEIRLKSPPLSEVICQVRFPTILKILKDPPIEFQELVRARFPVLEVEQPLEFRMPSPLSSEQPQATSRPKIYRFKSTDTGTAISLAVDFFAVATKQYRHWEEFAENIELASEAARQAYEPSHATRIGLRYTNRFTQANTGLKDFDQVIDLLHPDLTAMLRSRAWSDPVEMANLLVLRDETAKLSLRTGCKTERGEPFFLLDLDYFEEGQLDLNTLPARVDRYHTVIYDAFRWSLKDEALDLFEPVD